MDLVFRFLLFSLICAFWLIPSEARRHRHFHQQQQQDGHFSKQNLEQVPDDGTAESGGGGGRGRQHWWKKHRRTPRIICVHGSVAGGRCVCDQGWTGTNCQREMHCATFERSQNGSCTNCQPNFFGDLCDRLECQNGGEELVEEQKCNCSKPYSGTFCDELLTKNVYYFYNSKVATLGPLGLLSVIPMIGIYVVCERFARKRQVHRIEKTWNEQSECPIHVDPAHIELLLKEKA